MKVSRNESCPCGSGKKYKKCCMGDDDEIIRIPVTTEMREILDRENERFKEIMGRDIQGDDPLLPSTLQMSEEEYKEHVTKMLTDIDVEPSIIYAFNKLGFCLVKERWHFYSEEQKESWNNAIEEYENIQSGKIEIQDIITPVMEALSKNLQKLKLLYALILRKYSNAAAEITLSGTININDYILFCLTKNLKSINAIEVLIEKHYGEDALNLTRTNFENYLEIIYAKFSPVMLSKHFLIEEGVSKGTHKRQGKYIVDIKTGEKFKVLSNYEKAELNILYKLEDIEIYKYLYDFLSSFTHLDLRTAPYYVDQDLGFSDLGRNMKDESLIFLLIINFLILNEIKDINAFESSEKDIKNLLMEIGTNITKLIELDANLPSSIVSRIDKTMKACS